MMFRSENMSDVCWRVKFARDIEGVKFVRENA